MPHSLNSLPTPLFSSSPSSYASFSHLFFPWTHLMNSSLWTSAFLFLCFFDLIFSLFLVAISLLYTKSASYFLPASSLLHSAKWLLSLFSTCCLWIHLPLQHSIFLLSFALTDYLAFCHLGCTTETVISKSLTMLLYINEDLCFTHSSWLFSCFDTRACCQGNEWSPFHTHGDGGIHQPPPLISSFDKHDCVSILEKHRPHSWHSNHK